MAEKETQNSGSLSIQRHHGVEWIDAQTPDKAAIEKLEREYKLDPIHLSECTQKVQHTQVDREYRYLFLIVHFPILDTETDKISVGQLGIFLGKNFLVTIRSAASPATSNLFNACKDQAQKADDNFKHGSGMLLCNLIKQHLIEISAMTDHVTSELDDIEDLVFGNTASDAQIIGKLRQKIIRLRRIIGPKRLVLGDLAEQIDSFTKHNLSKQYALNTKLVNKLWEEIEEAKETVEIYKDADFTTSTERTNGILAVLTILFTLSIPVTVFGTLYGMNVNLPGGITTGAWDFMGKYTTFGILVAVSAWSALMMYAYFKKKNWL
ncbi:MAG TPA: magnesium transporter CorA family protein [Candidatus Saccharimonadales bacterium]|nr:magnesium transporter CorA family protein [Candidatus Saccharimonadales bacterium]